MSVEERAQVHGALGDPVRVAIVDELALSDRSPTELGERLSVRSNLLAHHLGILEHAGVVERLVSRGDRRRRYVRLTPGRLAGLTASPAVRVGGVVFVCTGNSARSPLAAALWNAVSVVPATSAGTEPAERVHPGAVRAARRRRLDLAGAVPARFDPEAAAGRLVVTVCDLAHEDLAAGAAAGAVAGPAAGGLPALHWSIADPAETGAARDFDAAVAALDARIGRLAPAVTAA